MVTDRSGFKTGSEMVIIYKDREGAECFSKVKNLPLGTLELVDLVYRLAVMRLTFP